MKSVMIVSAMAALAATAAPAQTSGTKKPAASKPAAKSTIRPATAKAITSGAVEVPGVSAEGNATLAKMRNAPDPEFANIIRQQQALAPQIGAAVMAPTVDVDKIADLLRQGESLRSQAQAKNIDRVIAAAKALPEADRGPFLRAIALSNAQRSATASSGSGGR